MSQKIYCATLGISATRGRSHITALPCQYLPSYFFLLRLALYFPAHSFYVRKIARSISSATLPCPRMGESVSFLKGRLFFSPLPLLENPRFFNGLRPALRHGKTTVFPTPFADPPFIPARSAGSSGVSLKSPSRTLPRECGKFAFEVKTCTEDFSVYTAFTPRPNRDQWIEVSPSPLRAF